VNESLTVIIPAYNAGATIEAAVASARSIGGAEIVVVDDGSTDATVSLVQGKADRIISQTNAGAAAARQHGLTVSSGDFVIFLDADDELEHTGVNESVRALLKDPSLSVAAGRVVGVPHAGPERLLARSTSHTSAAAMVEHGNGPWPPGAAVIRRTALDVAARIEEPNALCPRFAEDYELMIRLSLTGHIVQHETVSLRYRIFSGRTARSTIEELRDKERVRRHYAQSVSADPVFMSETEIRAASLARTLRVEAASGAYTRAVSLALKLVLLAPAFATKKVLVKLRPRRR
jgi:glycosyltransferase involved in cell wall biosynthesis